LALLFTWLNTFEKCREQSSDPKLR
jgi:hypothetical protein